jgi:2-octaprenylphenol hydroxylase
LKAFSRARKSEASEMIAAMEAIKQAFGIQQPGAKLLRGIGISLLDNIRPAKKLLIEKALGLNINLPKLASKQPN